MKTIKLPCFGIVVQVDTDNPGGGSINSNLHEETEFDNSMTLPDRMNATIFNAAMDGIEAVILAHACAGIDITTPAYIEGIETAVQACGNNL